MPKSIPDGYHSITAYLALSDAPKAIAFYKSALDAKEIYRLTMKNGKVGHAELQIGDTRMMLSDEAPAWGSRSPGSIGGTPVGLCLYTDAVDAVADRFVKAGGKCLRPLENQFYGDRSGQFEDPEGHKWILAQHLEDVTPEEMQRRAAKLG